MANVGRASIRVCAIVLAAATLISCISIVGVGHRATQMPSPELITPPKVDVISESETTLIESSSHIVLSDAVPGGDIPVHIGWNFISYALGAPDTSLPGILVDKIGNVVWSRVMWYNNRDNTDHWKQYNRNWVSGLNDLKNLNNTMGVWLYVTNVGDGVLNLTGAGWYTPSSTTINLYAGWNMVGFPSNDATYTVGMFMANIGQAGAMVEKFDVAAWPYLTSLMFWGDYMAMYNAYWVWVPCDAMWVKSF